MKCDQIRRLGPVAPESQFIGCRSFVERGTELSVIVSLGFHLTLPRQMSEVRSPTVSLQARWPLRLLLAKETSFHGRI
jgi:hypothetical protein